VRPIDAGLVDEVWSDITRYPADQVQTEARAFLEQQPHVAAFVNALTRELDETVQQAALGLCFLLFKILARSLGRPFPLVAEERIQTAYAGNVDWLAQTEAGAESVLDTLGAGRHPSLAAHLLSVFYGDADGGAGYDTQVKATLFLLLKTLTEALDIGLAAR
jgi:hypothetical protein